MAFGGYIVPRGPTGGETHGSVGLLKKALSLIGNGGKGIIWFEFGPEPNFPGKHEHRVILVTPELRSLNFYFLHGNIDCVHPAFLCLYRERY